MKDLLTPDAGGLYCRAGDFWIDPLRPVRCAVITHAHADHARSGAGAYFAARDGLPVLAHRVGETGSIMAVGYGQPFELNQARVTLFPAGHILGSATVRVETKDGTWGVS
ncbi:MAG: DNA ligase-associated DEXH box helicase, partial [Xanthomonadaceae bacterium]|nr:DNA ligase-associated DEXH box helicase [Xanthomonadaceae bacterium]